MRVELLNAEIVSCKLRTGKSGHDYLSIMIREPDDSITTLCDTNASHEELYIPGDIGTFFLSVISSQKYGTSIRVDRYLLGETIIVKRKNDDNDNSSEEWEKIFPM